MIPCIAFNRCRRICAYGTAFLLSLSSGCATEPEPIAHTEPPEPRPVSNVATVETTAVYFEDVGQTLGLDFENVSGGSEQGYILETISAGVAFFDSDGDGYSDIFFANGTRLEGETVGNHSRLYRSTEAATGERVFTEVSQQAGIDYSGWGMGCAVGDYDNDGDVDLYATYWGPNRLYRNKGNGRFNQIAEVAGVNDEGWGTSAAFGDLDQDGLLDLYVVNYLAFDLENPPVGWKKCLYKGLESFCGPQGMTAQSDRMYRNLGGDRFEDKTQALGPDRPLPGLGVVFGDYDNDSDADIYVANDSEVNVLYRNDGNWHLVDTAIPMGVGFSEGGRAQAGMGVHGGDYDNDGDLDLYVTNFSDDVNTLYRNRGNGAFVDATYEVGLGGAVLPYLGWSTGFFDYDNDGWQDVFVVNGHVYPQLSQYATGLSYAQRNLLYQNRQGRFVEVGGQAGPGWQLEQVSRGGAVGDYDNDGDPDLLVTNLNGRPALLRNDGGNTHNWLGLKLVGVQSNKDAIGTRVRVWAGDLVQTKEVQRGYGFQSQHDERLLFGLGRATRVDQVEIRWPSGLKQVIRNPLLRRYLIVHEGSDQIAVGTEVPAVVPAVRASAAQVRASDVAPQVTGAPDWGPADYHRSSEALFKQGRYLEARAMLQKALELDPEYIPAYINLGLVLFSGLGEFDAARKVLEQAVQIQPTRADAHHLLGKVYLHQQRLPEAIKALGQATLLKPQDWEHAHWLGLAYLRADSLVAAAGAFRNAARRAPWDPKPHLHLAQLYASKGQHEQAVKEQALFERLSLVQNRVELYEKKVADYPENARAHYLLGLTYVEQGRLALGLQFFERAIALNPSYAPAFHGKGRVLYQRNQIAQAIRAYEWACQLDTQLYDAFNDLGQAYHQSGRYDRAVAAYRRALEIKPDLALVHSNLGMAYAMQGNFNAATTSFKRSIELDPEAADTRDALAQVYAAQKNWSQAIAQWEAVLRLAPDHAGAAQGIHRARQRLAGQR